MHNFSSDSASSLPFHPIAAGALHPSIERGLTADVLATRALGGQAHTVCTSHVVAGHGVVTDVLDVPTDSVAAQLEHIFATQTPTGAKVGSIGHPATVRVIFRQLATHLDGPLLLDLTLSGPSGEDIIGGAGIEALQEHLNQPDLVTLRRTDAQLLAGMEIPSLDDAQVAVQRIAQLGARRVLIRCGRIATHFFDTDSEQPPYAVDLYYDGDDFSMFEAPYLTAPHTHGASSAYLMALLNARIRNIDWPDALQAAKVFVTEALRHSLPRENVRAPDYFWMSSNEPRSS